MTTALGAVFGSLGLAWVAGMAVGLERSFNGRAAGFRTHALVALASAAVMTIARLPALSPGAYVGAGPMLDPSHLAQGLMTGVGFLGAGVIFKEGVSIQGLTTAASIWSTAAFGALFGVGLWAPAAMATILVILTLTVLRWVEARLANTAYAMGVFQFRASEAPGEQGLRDMLGLAAVEFDDVSFSLQSSEQILEYSGVLRTRRPSGLAGLSEKLAGATGLLNYRIDRIGK